MRPLKILSTCCALLLIILGACTFKPDDEFTDVKPRATPSPKFTYSYDGETEQPFLVEVPSDVSASVDTTVTNPFNVWTFTTTYDTINPASSSGIYASDFAVPIAVDQLPDGLREVTLRVAAPAVPAESLVEYVNLYVTFETKFTVRIQHLPELSSEILISEETDHLHLTWGYPQDKTYRFRLEYVDDFSYGSSDFTTSDNSFDDFTYHADWGTKTYTLSVFTSNMKHLKKLAVVAYN